MKYDRYRYVNFRVWLPRKKEMLYEDFGVASEGGVFFLGDKSELIWPKNYILMQATQIKDKNGKWVFEGDIIKMRANSEYLMRVWFSHHSECCCAVYIDPEHKEWNETFWPVSAWLTTDYPEMEVVGNAYQNKELLRKKK